MTQKKTTSKKRNPKYGNSDPTKYNKNDYLKKVLDHLDKINMHVDTLLDLTDYTRQSLFVGSNSFPRNNVKMPFKLQTVSKLYFTCGIHPKTFVLDPKVEDEWFKANPAKAKKKKDYLTNDYWEILESFIDVNINTTIEEKIKANNSLLDYFPFKSHDPKENIGLAKTYKHIAEEYFGKAEKNITVFEVLFKGDRSNPDSGEAYELAQDHIYQTIQDWLDRNKEEAVCYTRILSVSQDTTLLAKDNVERRQRAMVTELSTATLEHVIWCMEHHPTKCTFYCSVGTWFRNIVFIDDKYSLTEDYVISNNLVAPDSIFIDDISESNPAYLYKASIMKQFDEQKKKEVLTIEVILERLGEAYDHVKEQISKRNDAIESIREAFKEKGKSMKELLSREEKILRELKRIRTNLFDKKGALSKKGKSLKEI